MMCGISAYFSSEAGEDLKKFLFSAQRMMKHRGPDASGSWFSSDEKIGLAHNRLSIVDLDFNANQPLLNSEHTLVIIFNGEIYNYKALRDELIEKGHHFKTKSDTEVILVLYEVYGRDFITKLIGMYAFCIYDIKRNIVFGARDATGEKPLYYMYYKNSLCISSELTPLQKYSIDCKLNEPDPENLKKLLCTGYSYRDRTLNINIRKVKPGHFFEYNVDTNNLRITSFLKPRKKLKTFSGSMQNLKDEFKSIFSDVVTSQLDADVDVGVLLSGGLDSSLVTGFASNATSKVNTYSVSFEGNEYFDESPFARQISKHFETNHVEINLRKITQEDFLNCIDSIDDPIVDSSCIPMFFLMKEIRKYQKVVLGGDGADELFGGYKHYQRLPYVYYFQKLFPEKLLDILLEHSEHRLPLGRKGSNWIRSIFRSLKSNAPIINPIFDETFLGSILENGVVLKDTMGLHKESFDVQASDVSGSFMRNDFDHYLCEDLLIKVDRMSMLNSVEVRSPFLDQRVVNFAFELDTKYKISKNRRKYFLQKVAEDFFPNDYQYNRKWGFSFPVNELFHRGEISSLVRRFLLYEQNIFSRNAIQTLYDELSMGRNHGERIYCLFILSRWMQRNSYLC